MRRNIPRMAIIRTLDDSLEVIDGKQRLSSMISFIKNEYTLEIDNKEYFLKDLPDDYQRVIECYFIPYYVVNEDYDNVITDIQKVNWFKFINFAGTVHERDYLNLLSNSIKNI